MLNIRIMRVHEKSPFLIVYILFRTYCTTGWAWDLIIPGSSMLSLKGVEFHGAILSRNRYRAWMVVARGLLLAAMLRFLPGAVMLDPGGVTRFSGIRA